MRPRTRIRIAALLTLVWCGALIAAIGPGAAAQDAAAVEKKLDLVAHYLDSVTAQRIRASGDARANDLLARAVDLDEQARRALADGDPALAERNAGLALRAISAASAALARGKASGDDLARRNDELRNEIAGYRESFDQALREKGPEFASVLDTARVDALLADADALTRQGRHADAGAPLREAYQLTVAAVTRLRRNETVVYSLNFRTPADEYRYEQKRNQSYELLVRQMVDSGNAQGPRGKLVDQFVGKARALVSQAEAQAARGDHQGAIATMEDANKNLVRALQMMGLSIPG